MLNTATEFRIVTYCRALSDETLLAAASISSWHLILLDCSSEKNKTRVKQVKMTRFENPTDFWGRYEGSHDGRRARLIISDTPVDAAWPVFRITLEDLDRDVTFRDMHHQRSRPPDGEHVLTDVQLNEMSGTREKTYRKLLLHTWNIEYLTGISVWQGREFGASFQRVS